MNAGLSYAAHSLGIVLVLPAPLRVRSTDERGFSFVEVYRSAEGHAQHKETEHYHAWNAAVADWLFEPRTRTVYVNISPADQDW